MGHNRAHDENRPRPIEDRPNHASAISHNISEFWRLNPLSFDGKPDPIVIESWIMQIKKIFIILELTKEKKVPLIAFMFTNEVEHWWYLKKETLPFPTT